MAGLLGYNPYGSPSMGGGTGEMPAGGKLNAPSVSGLSPAILLDILPQFKVGKTAFEAAPLAFGIVQKVTKKYPGTYVVRKKGRTFKVEKDDELKAWRLSESKSGSDNVLNWRDWDWWETLPTKKDAIKWIDRILDKP